MLPAKCDVGSSLRHVDVNPQLPRDCSLSFYQNRGFFLIATSNRELFVSLPEISLKSTSKRFGCSESRSNIKAAKPQVDVPEYLLDKGMICLPWKEVVITRDHLDGKSPFLTHSS